MFGFLFTRVFHFATMDTGLLPKFSHIHGEGFLLFIADAHKGQALGTFTLALCNVPLHHHSGPRLNPLPQYPQPAPRAKLSVCFSASRYVIVLFFPIVINMFPLCHCSHPFHYPTLLLYMFPLYLVS